MKQDKSDRKKKLMVGFIAFIMIFSVFGVVFFGFAAGGSSLKYNGFKFSRSGNVWATNIDGRQAIFSYYPADVELIEIKPEIIGMLRNKIEIDATADGNGTFIQSIALAHFQMKSTLGNFNIFLREGYTSENEFNLPVIVCENATQLVPVIYFKEGNATRVYSNESCIIVEANNNEDFIRAKDRIVYGLLDIIR